MENKQEFIYRGVIEYEYRDENYQKVMGLWHTKPYFGVAPAKAMLTRQQKHYHYYSYNNKQNRYVIRTYIERSLINWEEM